MPFLDGDVVVKEISETHWELLKPLVYQGRDRTFTVPVGFKTDFATVPKVFTWLVPPYGKYTKAAILHDFLGVTHPVSRSDADGIFRRAMRELGVSFVRRWMMWAAVRAGIRLADTNPKEVAIFLLVAIPSVLFLAIPAVVVFVWLTLYWVIEYTIFGVLNPISKGKQVNKPSFLLGADALHSSKRNT